MSTLRPPPSGNAQFGVSDRLGPRVVVTGFTSAFLGDERTLREFIVGDHVQRSYKQRGEQAVLYLINDSSDPLTFRQLRIGVGKENPRLEELARFCGQPIAEIPDPFGCHSSYARHFAHALEQRLHALDIHPFFIDTHQAYLSGWYAPSIAILFTNYHEIRKRLSEKFPDAISTHTLFRPQCPECRRLDATEIRRVNAGQVFFFCDACNRESERSIAELRGKLSWKLDCAARWNIYGVDCETFSKVHYEDLGTFGVARFMSEEYFGGRVPRAIQYGSVVLDRDLAFRLLEILPPTVLKAMFTHRLKRDLHLSRDFVENFCRKFVVRPNLSYLDYVRKELSTEVLRQAAGVGHGAEDREEFPGHTGVAKAEDEIGPDELLAYGNRFARHFLGREHALHLPAESLIDSTPPETLHSARSAILLSLSVRMDESLSEVDVKQRIRDALRTRVVGAELYRFLRRFFRQEEGPNVVTLLALLPVEHLRIALVMLPRLQEETGSASSRESTQELTPSGGKR